MAKLTRSGFIKKTSAGAATIGALAAAPSLTAAHAASEALAPDHTSAALREPMLAHVRNAASGEIAILVGTREVIVHDRELVKRLAKAAR